MAVAVRDRDVDGPHGGTGTSLAAVEAAGIGPATEERQ